MLHHTIVAELLEAEIAVAVEQVGQRIRGLHRTGADVTCELGSGAFVRFDGSRYDAEPYAVSMVNSAGDLLPGDRWPANVNHGEHPILDRPFICIRGTYEYHAHPSHLADHWDRYRGRIALVDLLDHILKRIGA